MTGHPLSRSSDAPLWAVWCLPGSDRARVVVQTDDLRRMAARTFHAGELVELRDGIDEALQRITATLCEREGHLRLRGPGGGCARCGEGHKTEADRLLEALRKLDVELQQQGVINERVGRHIIDQALGTRGQAPSVTSGAR